jgi:hypothetical protein
MRRHNPITPWRSSLGVLNALAFTPTLRSPLRAPRASAAPPLQCLNPHQTASQSNQNPQVPSPTLTPPVSSPAPRRSFATPGHVPECSCSTMFHSPFRAKQTQVPSCHTTRATKTGFFVAWRYGEISHDEARECVTDKMGDCGAIGDAVWEGAPLVRPVCAFRCAGSGGGI